MSQPYHFDREMLGWLEDALLVGLSEHGECERIRAHAETLEICKREFDKNFIPAHPTCNVDHSLVERIRDQLAQNTSCSKSRTYVHHESGKPTTMRTENIGRRDSVAGTADVVSKFSVALSLIRSARECEEEIAEGGVSS